MNGMEIHFSGEAHELPQAGDSLKNNDLPSESDVRLFREAMDRETPPRESGGSVPDHDPDTQEASLFKAERTFPRSTDVPSRNPADALMFQEQSGKYGGAVPNRHAATQEASLPRTEGNSPYSSEIPPHAPVKEGSGMRIETELENVYLRRMNEASGMAQGSAERFPDGAGRSAAAERSRWENAPPERSGNETANADQDDGVRNPSPISVQDMFRAAMSPVDAIFPGSTEQVSSAPQTDMKLLESMVERILVSAPEQGGQEVRLAIQSDSLRSTEITIRRDAEGWLSVVLHSADQAAFQTLVSAQGELRQILESNEKAEVRVSVTGGAGDAHPEENDSRQRSRGYFTQYGQDEQ